MRRRSSFFFLVASIAALLPRSAQEDTARRRKKARVSIHRGTFEESVALRDAGRRLQLPHSDQVVVVGMTTTPTRIEYIRPAIESLLNQTQPTVIVLNVPEEYNDRRNHWKNNRKMSSVPGWLLDSRRRVVVHRTQEDWGPATKLVGTAVAYSRGLLPSSVNERTFVVASDDDHEWEPYALATLVQEANRTTYKDGVFSYYTYPYPRGKQQDENHQGQVCVAQAGDMLAVRMEYIDRLPEWGREVVVPEGRLPNCFYVDDLFFAAYFRHVHQLPVYWHPWRFWLFKEAQRVKRSLTASPLPACKGACSPVSIRLRYPDSLAMGPPRDKHNTNCKAQLEALRWWPTKDDGDSPPCIAPRTRRTLSP